MNVAASPSFMKQSFRMKSALVVLTAILLTMSSTGAQVKVPSSERSRAAVARVESRLKQDLSAKGLELGAPVFIRIFKEPAILEMWVQREKSFELFRTYKVCTFSGKLGPKLKEGDKQAPEGIYTVSADQMNPNSSYHLSFNLGYPNEFDRHHGRTGSFLMVHGACASIGCYAMGDDAIEEIWTLCSRALENGQSAFAVHCFPFRLTNETLRAHGKNQWISFWKELLPIYQEFEEKRVPPQVVVTNGRYQIKK
ncbi:MAG: murein L,D-transpeptidase family protein [Limisphaerales bacterium]